jgi:hypothetical protein
MRQCEKLANVNLCIAMWLFSALFHEHRDGFLFGSHCMNNLWNSIGVLRKMYFSYPSVEVGLEFFLLRFFAVILLSFWNKKIS